MKIKQTLNCFIIDQAVITFSGHMVLKLKLLAVNSIPHGPIDFGE